ncbi:MAG TPA: YibE/F family protein [Candidatus Limnocylindria bacterium]|nr:YibE/F family protein [Candidatus Limnocylindria bacterium]
MTRVVRLAATLVLALTVTACVDWNKGQGLTVIDAHVVRVLEAGDRNPSPTGLRQPFQRLEIQLDGSLFRGNIEVVEWGGRRALDETGFLRPGDRVLVTESREGQQRRYAIEEVVRLPNLVPPALLLLAALLAVGQVKGLAALAGLASSVAVFLLAIVPALQRGGDPLVATLLGAAGVVTVSVFVVHGPNRKSLAALLGTFAGLVVVAAVGAFGIVALRISGFGSEDQVFLAVGTEGRIDMPRLVLAGLIVGSLGALVDMCVGQASATTELYAVDPDRDAAELFRSALNVGRDHIGSLVNTLALAYFGGALPLVLLLSLGFQPLSVALNSEEIVGSLLTVLAASVGLVLCVPITTAISVYLARRGFLREEAADDPIVQSAARSRRQREQRP